MITPSTSTLEAEHRPRINGWKLGGAVVFLVVIFIVGYVVGGEFRNIVVASLESLPFTALALLAYLGIDRLWGKVLALVWLALLVGGIVVFGLLYTFAAVKQGGLSEPTLQLIPGGGAKLGAVFGASCLAMLIGALGFVPAVRRRLSLILPIDPDSFVHMIALVMVTTTALLCFIPLIILGEPPALVAISKLPQGTDLTAGRSDYGQLLDRFYALGWTIPGAVIAVGYAVRRNLRQALARLGLVRPTLRQVALGLGMAVVLVVLVQIIGQGIDRLWTAMGWPHTDEEAFGQLLKFAMSPLGAVVIGVTAGIGEELAVRGVLQPRLGILLSNLFFTSLHAFQYNWDSLIVVFAIGMVLGVIRKRTNTTTSAITHGTYDFLLVLASVYSVPGFSQ